MLQKVIALDFDGTLCERAWPGIGAPKWPVIRAALEEQRQGALLILWTTREGEELDEALTWCKDVGLNLDGVNTSAQSWKDAYQNDPRKIGATEYWDDRAVDVAIIETRQMLKEETRRRQAAWNTAKRAYQTARWPWQRWQLKREARRACCDYLDVYIAQRNAEAHKICEAARAAYEKAYVKRSAE